MQANCAEDPEEIRVERRLVEYLVSDPVSIENRIGPTEISLAISSNAIETWLGMRLPEHQGPYEQRRCEYERRRQPSVRARRLRTRR